MAGSRFEKARRADWRQTASAAECLAQNLQWQKAAARKAVPSKIAPIPPAVTRELSALRPFKSGRCRLTIINIPKIEKPRPKLIKLIPVEIFCSLFRLSNRAGVSAFPSFRQANPRLKLQRASIILSFFQWCDERTATIRTTKQRRWRLIIHGPDGVDCDFARYRPDCFVKEWFTSEIQARSFSMGNRVELAAGAILLAVMILLDSCQSGRTSSKTVQITDPNTVFAQGGAQTNAATGTTGGTSSRRGRGNSRGAGGIDAFGSPAN
jgi:hypothetical protein